MSAESLDPLEFDELARAVVALSREEVYLRTAINRAYYACFHLARRGLRRRWSWRAPAAGEHRAVVQELRFRRRDDLARNLGNLLELREQADYELARRVDDAAYEEARRLADWLLPRLQSL